MGGLDTSQNPQVMEFGVWGYKIMTSGFYCTNLEQTNSRKLLKVLFKHMSPINAPKMAILIPICFPMMFLYFFALSPNARSKNTEAMQGDHYGKQWRESYISSAWKLSARSFILLGRDQKTIENHRNIIGNHGEIIGKS